MTEKAPEVRTAQDVLRDLLAYEDDRPGAGTRGAELYDEAERVLASPQPESLESLATVKWLLDFDDAELRPRLEALRDSLELRGPDVDLLVTLNLTVKCPSGTVLEGNSIRLPNGEVLRVAPSFELCDDDQGEYLDLTYDQLTARGVYYEIQRVEVEADL